MSLYVIAPQPWLVFLSDAGLYIPNGQLAVYAAGTSTPATVYTAASGTPHPWPITLDAAGRVPGGLYLQSGLLYKFVLHLPLIEEPLDGAIVKTQDEVGVVPPGGTVLKIMTPGDYPNLNVAGVGLIEYHGTGDLTIRGMVGGVEGQVILIRNLTNYVVWLYAYDPAAPAGAAMFNFITNGGTPINGVRGMASYTYLSNHLWAMNAHSQGAALRQAYDPANYVTRDVPIWTVDAADIIGETFYVEGVTMFFGYYYQNTSLSAPAGSLARVMPYGWLLSTVASTNAVVALSGAPGEAGIVVAGDVTHLAFGRLPTGTLFPAGTNHITMLGQIAIPLG